MHGGLAEILYGFVHTVKFVEWANVLEQFLKRFSSMTDLCCQLQHPVHNQVEHLQNHIHKSTSKISKSTSKISKSTSKSTSKDIKEYIKGYQRIYQRISQSRVGQYFNITTTLQ